MATIQAPVEKFTGNVVGVQFTDGVGETEDDALLAYFGRHGYKIGAEAPGEVVVPDGDPSLEWTTKQLTAYAEGHDIDLGKAKSKPDILGAITEAAPAE